MANSEHAGDRRGRRTPRHKPLDPAVVVDMTFLLRRLATASYSSCFASWRLLFQSVGSAGSGSGSMLSRGALVLWPGRVVWVCETWQLRAQRLMLLRTLWMHSKLLMSVRSVHVLPPSLGPQLGVQIDLGWHLFLRARCTCRRCLQPSEWCCVAIGALERLMFRLNDRQHTTIQRKGVASNIDFRGSRESG